MSGHFRTAGGVALALALGAAGLSACNRNEAAQPSRTQVNDRGPPASSGGGSGSTGGGYGDSGRSDRGSYGDRGSSYGGGRYDRDDRAEARPREATPDFNGKPMWSDNRRHSAQENAQYHFERDGADLGAKTLNEYLTKVHDFVEHPPSGAETINRPNGDKLIYDAKTNLFAVARRDGAPRTAFKPRDGADYWKKQQARAEDEKNGRGSDGYRRSSRADRDEG